jgi:hypothetical protein
MTTSRYASRLLARLIIPEDRFLFTSFHLVKAFKGVSPTYFRSNMDVSSAVAKKVP